MSSLDDLSTIDDHGGWPALLGALLDRTHLTNDQARAAMNTILRGDATPAGKTRRRPGTRHADRRR